MPNFEKALFIMADYDTDSSAGEDIETGVTLGYATKDATGDDFSQLGGHPVSRPAIDIYVTIADQIPVMARRHRHPFRNSGQMQSLQRLPQPLAPTEQRSPGQIPRPRKKSLPLRMQEKSLPQKGWLSPRYQNHSHLSRHSG